MIRKPGIVRLIVAHEPQDAPIHSVIARIIRIARKGALVFLDVEALLRNKLLGYDSLSDSRGPQFPADDADEYVHIIPGENQLSLIQVCRPLEGLEDEPQPGTKG